MVVEVQVRVQGNGTETRREVWHGADSVEIGMSQPGEGLGKVLQVTCRGRAVRLPMRLVQSLEVRG